MLASLTVRLMGADAGVVAIDDRVAFGLLWLLPRLQLGQRTSPSADHHLRQPCAVKLPAKLSDLRNFVIDDRWCWPVEIRLCLILLQ